MSARAHVGIATAPSICRRCIAIAVGAIAAVVASFVYLGIDLGGLLAADSRRYVADFIVSFFPPELSAPFLARVGWAALETLAISALGTLLAVAAGLLLALPASGRYGRAAAALARFVLNVLRSVPELVWATLTVLAAGLGAFAGTLALALHTTGVLGRLIAETLENAPRAPAQSLIESGSPPAMAFAYGTFPTIVPQLLAYSLYRWEMNIRMAAVLGFVGAGGLGAMLFFHLSIFQQGEASTVILAMLVLVVVVDTVSAMLRRRLLRAGS